VGKVAILSVSVASEAVGQSDAEREEVNAKLRGQVSRTESNSGWTGTAEEQLSGRR
jgi:hypothetical protein